MFVPASWLRYGWYPLFQLIFNLPQHNHVVPSFTGETILIILAYAFLSCSTLTFLGPGSASGITPMIWSLKFLNISPWRGLVMQSPIISSVGHQTTETSPFLTLSVINKDQMLILFVPFHERSLPIFLRKNGTLVFLVQKIILNIVSLCHNEISGLADGLHEVVNTHDFCIRGTFRVELLFCGANDWEYISKK